MQPNQGLDQFTIELYEKLKDQRKITPILMQKYAKVDNEMAIKICEKVWRMLWEDARRMAEEVVIR
jgi:hypothetical protein